MLGIGVSALDGYWTGVYQSETRTFRVSGSPTSLPTKWDNALMALTSLVTVVSFEAVGAILVIAFLVLPVAAAYLLTTKLNYMMILSVVFSMIACVIGYYLSLVLNTSISSAIVTTMGVLFCLSFIFVLLNKRRVTYEGS